MIDTSALAITPSHQQNTHDFTDGCKNMNGIFNDYVCSASYMRSGLDFQNLCESPDTCTVHVCNEVKLSLWANKASVEFCETKVIYWFYTDIHGWQFIDYS